MRVTHLRLQGTVDLKGIEVRAQVVRVTRDSAYLSLPSPNKGVQRVFFQTGMTRTAKLGGTSWKVHPDDLQKLLSLSPAAFSRAGE